MATTTKFGIGQAVRRKEDERLLTGTGRYTDDVKMPGALHAHFVRSPHARAQIASIDTTKARQAPGVVAVYTHADLTVDKILPLPVLTDIPVKAPGGGDVAGPPRHALAADEVRYVGEAVAIVIAATHAQAMDAAERVEVRYRTLPAVVDPAEATKGGAPALWPAATGNVAGVFAVGDVAAVDQAIAGAAHVVKVDLVNNRLAPNTMEPRAILCDFESATRKYTVHVASQASQGFKMALAAAVLQVPPDNVRIVVGDIGGGFGMKVGPYPEYVAVCYASGKLGRPVRWVASRSEAFLADTHGRAHTTHAELALDKNGRILALKIRNLADMGAYLAYVGPLIPTIAAGQVITNVYDIKLMHAEILCVLTNTTPVDAYRGAGRPESVFMMERLMDLAAAATGLDPAEVRRRNLIPKSALPYTTLLGAIYDSGDYAAILDRTLREGDWAGFPARKAEAATRGKLAGRGLSCYVEITGAFDPVEHVQVTVSGDRVQLIAGTQSMGQGLDTSFSQLLAEKLGVPFECIDVIQGDTDVVKAGSGSIGSRSSFVGGQAVLTGGEEIIKLGRDLAADALETAGGDITFADGRFTVTGTDRSIGLFELARRQTDRRIHVAATSTAGGMSYPNGANICEVEIDRETGELAVTRFTAVNDVGTVINPMIVAGQVHGGVAQGIGQALHEQIVYDRSTGQLVTGSYLDYAMPRADDVPPIATAADESTPSPTNIIGAKGAGEAGAVSAPPAVIAAAIDALAEFGVRHLDMPVRAETLWRTMQRR